MKVAPVSEVPNFLPGHVPQIYISRDPCSHISFDIELMGDCDVVVAELCRRAGWNLKHEMIPKNQTVTVEQVDRHVSRWTFKSSKPQEISLPVFDAAIKEKLDSLELVHAKKKMEVKEKTPEVLEDFVDIDYVTPEKTGIK